MENLIALLYLTLQGLSTSIIDLFFFMTVLVTFMTIYRFGQFEASGKCSFKKARHLTVAYIVQGIGIGTLYSMVVIFIGLPIMYTDYLYFLLPLSFVLGMYHIRFTNLIYSATMLAVFGSVLNGQTYGGTHMPDIGLEASGLALSAGLIMVLLGVLMYLTGSSYLVPIAVKEGDKRFLGFAMQRLWPIPVVMLAAVSIVATGDVVPMPSWWPLLELPTDEGMPLSMFVLPLLLIVSHGSVSFGQSPKAHVRYQYRQQVMSGLVLIVLGYVGSRFGGFNWLIVFVMVVISAIPEVYWYYKELGQAHCYEINGKGVYITGLTKGSKGAAIGLEVGDCISQVNDEEVSGYDHLSRLSINKKETQNVIVIRDGRPLTFIVDKYPLTHESFGLTFLKNKGLQVYDFEGMKHMNMMHLMNFKKKGDPDS